MRLSRAWRACLFHRRHLCFHLCYLRLELVDLRFMLCCLSTLLPAVLLAVLPVLPVLPAVLDI